MFYTKQLLQNAIETLVCHQRNSMTPETGMTHQSMLLFEPTIICTFTS